MSKRFTGPPPIRPLTPEELKAARELEALLANEGLAPLDDGKGMMDRYDGSYFQSHFSVEEMITREAFFTKAQCYLQNCHRLTKTERAVLEPFAMKGATVGQIQKLTGLSNYTVKKTLAELKDKIRKYRPRG